MFVHITEKMLHDFKVLIFLYFSHDFMGKVTNMTGTKSAS